MAYKIMRSGLKYPVAIENKIPVISKILEKLSLIFGAVAAVFFILHLPFFSARTEMEQVATINIYPATLGKILLFSAVGFCFFYFLNVRIRSSVKGFLHFEEDAIIVETSKFIKTIQVSDISEIKFYDPSSVFFSPVAKKLFIFIFPRLVKPMRLKLLHYEHAEEVIDSFLGYNLGSMPRDAYSLAEGEEPI